MQICLEPVERLEARIRQRLAESLDSLWQQSEASVTTDPVAREALLQKIVAQPQHPRVFARYYELALTLMESRIARAQSLSDGLLALDASSPTPGIYRYSHAELGDDFELIGRLLFAEEGLAEPLAEPPEAQFQATSDLLADAYALIDQIAPEAAKEIRALWPMLFLARPKEIGKLRFAGVASFMVWGAGFMNVEAFKSPWEVASFLVHETTHSLLFALGCDEVLVKNPVEDNYTSPLRRDPRPMDGIFHATVVCARVLDFHRRCIDTEVSGVAPQTLIEEQIAAGVTRYQSGRRVIDEHGLLSARAQNILETCDQFLNAAA